MRRSRSRLFVRPGILMIILFILVRCIPGSDLSSIKIQETGGLSLQGLAETIQINNCGGETEIEQNIQQMHQIDVSNISSKDNIRALKDIIAEHYAKEYGATKDINLRIPPKTNMEFVIAWIFETHDGIVTDKKNLEQATYMIKLAFGVGPVSSTDLGC